MILIFCHKITHRTAYAISLVMETILGMEWQITDDFSRFSAYQGVKILYGNQTAEGVDFFIKASGFLSLRGITAFAPETETRNGLVVLFPHDDNDCALGFDIFSAAFYLASRYEEYLPANKDRFGRFEAGQSLAFAKGFLHMPVVEHYALLLKSKLCEKFVGLNVPVRAFTHLPTIDVDIAYAYKGRGILRTLFGGVLSIARFDKQSLKERYRVLTGKVKDPFDTYDDLRSLHKRYGCKAHYFFLCGDYGPYDKNISWYSVAFQKLVKKMGDYAHIGVHPSMASNKEGERLPEEIRRISSIVNQPVRYSRQHFLMLSMPTTYQQLIKHGITHDFSMGYASQPGFRAGLCTPYPFYDLSNETATKLMVVPLAIMDGTLRDYLEMQPESALQVISSTIQAVRDVHGTFVSLWHNDAFSDHGAWHGWRRVYEELMRLAATS
jgi:hypothetical protein